MKPKTRIQIEVDRLSRTVPSLTRTQLNWARERLFPFNVYKTKHEATCLTCGHRWTDHTSKDTLLHSIGGYTCPKCKRELTPLSGMERTTFTREYATMITTHKGYQLVRIFYFSKRCKAGENVTYFTQEIAQHWIRKDGKVVVRAIGYNAFGWGDNWRLGSDMEIRVTGNDRFYEHAKLYFPNKRVLPIFRRNGYKGHFHTYHPAFFFTLILTCPKAETLLKAKQIPLFKEADRRYREMERYWPSVRICMRNNYIVKEPGQWFDHLYLLLYFKKDIYNPKYICSPTFKQDHQRLIAKKEALEDRDKIAQRRKIEEENKEFMKVKKRLFNLSFADNDITIVVLKSVNDFKEEGTALKHCVYTNGYHKKAQSLIMSARKEATRLETIEVDLRDISIVQSRGLDNEPSQYHKQILELMSKNLPQIRKIAKSIKEPVIQ